MRQGDVIAGRFEIEQIIVDGNPALFCRARDRSSGQLAAVKILAPLFAEDAARMMLREGDVLATLDHPGIVRYVAHGTDTSGVAYVAMEWLKGEGLDERIY